MVGPISTSPERVRLAPVESYQGATGELVMTVRGMRPTKFVFWEATGRQLPISWKDARQRLDAG